VYIPHHHKNENIDEVRQFLLENSFGILLNQNGGKIIGSHIPLELEKDTDGNDVLIGHLAKANPQAKLLKNDDEVLAIFNGPHSYVSSSWYNHENVPTWNYIAVHVYGKLRIIEGEALLEALKRLVNKYERHSENPVSVEGMSGRTLKQVQGIVGFTIAIDEIQAAYKLSQNRDERDYHNITAELNKTGDVHSAAVAEEMKKLKK